MSLSQSHQTVLVVEDEPIVRMYAVDLLQDAGYDVIEAGDAEQALAQLDARADVALMFSDINMPGEMDGFALAREVHRRRPDIRLILTSGKMAMDASVADIDAFVAKPYTADRLTSLLRASLN
jgi:CheY-like chemotaxis protein